MYEWDYTKVELPAPESVLPKQVNWLHKQGNLHPACYACIKRRMAKSDSPRDDNGNLEYKKGDFIVECRGIPKDYTKIVPPEVWKTWSSSKQDDFLQAQDPIYWAEKYLNWTPRVSALVSDLDYQAVLVRCSAKRKQSRLGRRSGKTASLSVVILHHAFTVSSGGVGGKEAAIGNLPNGDVLVITPGLTQINVIFKEIRKLLARSALLSSSVVKDNSSPPPTIELSNGNTIIGQTAGVKSGSKAMGARGQGAGLVVFDETDYIDNESIENVVVIAGENKHAKIWSSSTPSGSREGKFYLQHLLPYWAEFHFPSQVNPSWNIKQENEFKQSLDRLSYIHEIEAEFGDLLEGVFPVRFVDIATKGVSYKYGSNNLDPECIGKKPGWYYAMGVDWNQNTGNQIVICGLNPQDGKIYLVDRSVVEQEHYQQAASIKRIVEMNRQWRCNSIYIDRGGGGDNQYEQLHMIGAKASQLIAAKATNHPDYKYAQIDKTLLEIVQAIDFGSKTEVMDPLTNEAIKKPTKPLMVQNTMRLFENQQIVFPEWDNKLRQQLLSYVVESISKNGQIVYASNSPEKIGDHIIDALFLANWAIIRENTGVGQLSYDLIIDKMPQGLLPDINLGRSPLSVEGDSSRTLVAAAGVNPDIARTFGKLAPLLKKPTLPGTKPGTGLTGPQFRYIKEDTTSIKRSLTRR